MKKIALGADIGGSHIACGLFDLTTSQMLGKIIRLGVNSRSSKETILGSWAAAINKTVGEEQIDSFAGIGFAMPGPFDYRNGIAWFQGVQKFDNLNGVDVRSELKRLLHLPSDFPIRFLNDAACFAVGEAWLGEVSVHKRIIALTLGTGFGTAFIKDGFPIDGSKGIPDDGFLYNVPFKNSIADDYFSTRWFLKEFEVHSGKKLTEVKELFELVSKEEEVRKIFQRFGENLGTFLLRWIKEFNADAIVMGGNISKSYLYFQNELKMIFLANGISPKIYVSTLGENAALTGSALLCDNEFYGRLLNTVL